ncbi:hypothetical protein DH2020_022077 [Rehmannia glutinosa]|uniref:At5g58720/SDE5-like UBA-like domain-containing protein n=1 Tax=Rehmannia glutinosa TaxID=99300 RepID=A0ABR0WG27_REHGL
MKQSKKKKRSKVSINGNAENHAKIADEKEQRILKNLLEAFGSVSVEEAASAYAEVNRDPNKAAEVLPKSAAPEDQSTTCSSSSGNYDVGSSSSSSVSEVFGDPNNFIQDGFKQKSKPKLKKVIASAGTVSTVLGKDYVRSIPKKGSSKLKGFHEERWCKEEAEQFLCSMLGDDCELSFAALDVLLEMSASSREQASGYNESTSREDEHLLESNSGVDFKHFRHRSESAVMALFLKKTSNVGSTEWEWEKQKGEGLALQTVLVRRRPENGSPWKTRAENGGGAWRRVTGFPATALGVPADLGVASWGGRREQLTVLNKNFPILTLQELEPIGGIKNTAVNLSKICESSENHHSTETGNLDSELPQKVLESLFKMPTPKTAEHTPNAMNWRNVVKKMTSLGQRFEPGDSERGQLIHAKGDEYKVLRDSAQQHWHSMKSYYQKGRLQNKMAREADEKASQDIFTARWAVAY